LDGFMGFDPQADGFGISPRLPKDWPEFTVDQIHWHGLVLSIRATHKQVEITRTGSSEPVRVTIDGKRPILWSDGKPLKAQL